MIKKNELTGTFQEIVEDALFNTPIGKEVHFTFKPSGRKATVKIIKVSQPKGEK